MLGGMDGSYYFTIREENAQSQRQGGGNRNAAIEK